MHSNLHEQSPLLLNRGELTQTQVPPHFKTPCTISLSPQTNLTLQAELIGLNGLGVLLLDNSAERIALSVFHVVDVSRSVKCKAAAG